MMRMAYSIAARKYAGGEEFSVAVRGLSSMIRALQIVDAEAAVRMRERLKEIGNTVALVAAADAPRNTGELQHSIKSSATITGASVYSTAVYGGAINYGAWTLHGRGPHITRARASHYMTKATTALEPWVEAEVEELVSWVQSTLGGTDD